MVVGNTTKTKVFVIPFKQPLKGGWNGGLSVLQAHRHAAVGSDPLGQLRLSVDVNGLSWFQGHLADLPIVQEAADLLWPHQELELVPLPVVQCLEESAM